MNVKTWLNESNHKYPKLTNGEAWATFAGFAVCGYLAKIAVENVKSLLDCPNTIRSETERVNEDGETELHVVEQTVTERVYKPVHVGINKLYIRKYW